MSQTLEQFFYDIMSNIEHKLQQLDIDQYDKDNKYQLIKKVIAQYWTLFHTQFTGKLGEKNIDLNKHFKEGIYDLILSSTAQDGDLQNCAQAAICEVIEKQVQTQNPDFSKLPSAPSEMDMERGHINKSASIAHQYSGKLLQLFNTTLGITLPASLAQQNHNDSNTFCGPPAEQNFTDTQFAVATTVPLQNSIHTRQVDSPIKEIDESTSRHLPNSSPSTNTKRSSSSNDGCDDCCQCIFCCPTTGYGRGGYYSSGNVYTNQYGNNIFVSGGGYGGDTVICCNGNDCTECAKCCEGGLHCVTNGCGDLFSCIGQSLSGISNCCIADICAPVCSIIGNCQCPDCKQCCDGCGDCGDCKCDCGDDPKGCLACVCSPCIACAGAMNKLFGGDVTPTTTSTTTTPPLTNTTPAPHRHLVEVTTNASSLSTTTTVPTHAAVDSCTALMNKCALFIDRHFKIQNAGMQCSANTMHGGLKTTAGTGCCLAAATMMSLHLCRRLIVLNKLCCHKPDPIARGHLNRNIAALCCISACCAAGLMTSNPYHSYRTATFLGSLSTWFCNRVDIALAGEVNFFGCKDKNGIFGYRDITGTIAKLKQLITEDYNKPGADANAWLAVVSSIINHDDSVEIDNKVTDIEDKINQHLERIKSAKNDGCFRSTIIRICENFLLTTGPSRQGCCSTQQLMGGLISCLNKLTTCKTRPQSSNRNLLATSSTQLKQDMLWELPGQKACCGISKRTGKNKIV